MAGLYYPAAAAADMLHVQHHVEGSLPVKLCEKHPLGDAARDRRWVKLSKKPSGPSGWKNLGYGGAKGTTTLHVEARSNFVFLCVMAHRGILNGAEGTFREVSLAE
jgi:hypothetical protein